MPGGYDQNIFPVLLLLLMFNMEAQSSGPIHSYLIQKCPSFLSFSFLLWSLSEQMDENVQCAREPGVSVGSKEWKQASFCLGVVARHDWLNQAARESG